MDAIKPRSPYVYRLETKEGLGPFHPDVTARWPFDYAPIRGHNDPYSILCNIHLPQELMSLWDHYGFCFGWRSRALYDQFFWPGQKAKWAKLGLTMHRYQPQLRFDFPDGQVIFCKDISKIDVVEYTQQLMAVLSTHQRGVEGYANKFKRFTSIN